MARTHVRQQIREAIVCELVEIEDVGGRVFPFQVFPTQDDELPAISVLTPTDVLDPDTATTSTFQTRNLTIILEIRVKITDRFADLIDTISMNVEETLVDAFEISIRGELPNLLVDLDPQVFEIDIGSETDKPVAKGSLVFFAQYKYDTRDVSTVV